jgi:hypothetical protein
MLSQSIASRVMNHLTPELITRISTVSGKDRATVSQALRALVPGLLWALARLAETPGGIDRLGAVLGSHPASEAERPQGLPAGASDPGAEPLAQVLGHGMYQALTAAVERYAGLAEGEARELFMIASSIAVGALTRAQREASLGSPEIALRLASELEDIESTVPPEFLHQLRATEAFIAPNPPPTRAEMAQAAVRERPRPRSGLPPAGEVVRSNAPAWGWTAAGILAVLALIWLAQLSLQRYETAEGPPVRPAPEAAAGKDRPAITVGLPLYSSDGVQLGEVSGLILAPDRSLRAVRAELGSNLGLGGRVVIIGADQVHRREDRAVIDVTASEARNLPPAPAEQPSSNQDSGGTR